MFILSSLLGIFALASLPITGKQNKSQLFFQQIKFWCQKIKQLINSLFSNNEQKATKMRWYTPIEHKQESSLSDLTYT